MSKLTRREVSEKRNIDKTLTVDFMTLWKNRNLAIPLMCILMFTALLYARSLHNGILSWDDGWHVTYNKDVQSFDLKKIFSSYYGSMYHPLTTLTFALEYSFVGLNPMIYHATNVFFHLANIVLVFLFVFRLSGRRETAFIAACLFGIHPMHVESVAWITERKDVVFACFYLYASISYLRFLQREGKKYYWAAFLFYILSLFSKTTAITFPVVLLLIDFYVGRKVEVKTLIQKLPFFLLSCVFGYIALQSQSDSIHQDIFKNYYFIDRFFLASYSLCYYCIRLCIPLNLSALHLMPEKINGFLPLEYYLAVIPLVGFLVLVNRKGVFRREYLFGSLFFIATISLTVHLIPVGIAIVSERYTYLPYIGLYYIIGQFYCFVTDQHQNLLLPWKKVILGGAVMIVAFFGFLTYQRIGVWENTLMLFTDASKKASTIKEAHFIEALGYEHEATGKLKSSKYTEAIEWYTKAIALNPQTGELFSNRGIAKHGLHDYEGAMKDYSQAIEINPSLARAYPNRAAIYLLWNKRKEACADLWTAYNLGIYNVFEIMRVDCP